ncbi:unnamed protein product [Closterium sp. NIES-64]|nr:unnamed protein product [Closterium sp. NIES-64]
MADAAERRVLIMGDGGSPAGAAMWERAGGGRQHVLHLAHPKTGASLAGARWRVGSRGACGGECEGKCGGECGSRLSRHATCANMHHRARVRTCALPHPPLPPAPLPHVRLPPMPLCPMRVRACVHASRGSGVLHAAGRRGVGGGVVQRRALLVAAQRLRAPRGMGHRGMGDRLDHRGSDGSDAVKAENGSLFMATPIDAAFLLLPILDKSRMKKEGSSSEGMFRSLDEICTVDGFPSYGWLQSQGVWDPVLPLITDIREVGSTRFYRLNDSRVLAWLTCKVAVLKAVLRQHGEAPVRGLPDSDLEAYAVGLLGEYLPASFHAALCRHLTIRSLPNMLLTCPLHTSACHPRPSRALFTRFILLPYRPLSPLTPLHATLCPYLLLPPTPPHAPSSRHGSLAAVCRVCGSEGEVKQSHQVGQRLASPPATTATQPKVSSTPLSAGKPGSTNSNQRGKKALKAQPGDRKITSFFGRNR